MARKNILKVSSQFQPLFRQLGLDAEAIFSHELIRPWRSLPDRQNCTLDFTTDDGEAHRWHVKRYAPSRLDFLSTAQREVAGYRALTENEIPTANLVGWGNLSDGRSFVITEDLDGYQPSDKLLRDGAISFDQLLQPLADLTALLHRSNLHHRDLYLCHFFARELDGEIRVRLIDVARVRPLPLLPTRRRWIIKDLSQFWFSTMEFPAITDAQRDSWLHRYAEKRPIDPQILRAGILRKSGWIARHDRQLRKTQPNRNIPIPQ